ncbi:MAG TPA: hypothetical protein VIX37_16030, partial [Candidatus Sulfotelmatobacter sp.]
MSYHLYQGSTNGIVLVTIFAVFSIYFWKTRRLAPVVLAHLCIDRIRPVPRRHLVFSFSRSYARISANLRRNPNQ